MNYQLVDDLFSLTHFKNILLTRKPIATRNVCLPVSTQIMQIHVFFLLNNVIFLLLKFF